MRTTPFTDPIDGYLNAMQSVLAGMNRESLQMTISLLFQAWEQRKQIFVLGNGGSASTASHVGNDLSKATVFAGMPRMKVISLTDNVALMTAWANDTSYDAMFVEQLENLLEAGDAVIGISASGNSPNVLRAMEFAKSKGAVAIGWTGLSGGRLKDIVDCCVHAPTEDVGMIENVHLIVDHIVTNMLRDRIEHRAVSQGLRREAAVGALSL